MDVNEIAREVTAKIREEIAKIKIVDFAEVKTIRQLANGGWVAKVLLPGATQNTTELNCLAHYVPVIGNWVMIVYPQGSSPVIVGKCPV